LPNNRLPHVLYLIDHLAAIGGGEAALLKITRNLPKERFRCSVATFKIGELDLSRELTVPLHVFPLRRTYGVDAIRTAAKLRTLIREQQIEIVHTFFETSNLWGGLVAKLGGGPRLISSRRDMGILRARKHRIAYRVVNRLCDGVVAVSDQVRKWCIEKERIDASKVVTVHNGVELERIDREQSDFAAIDGLAVDESVPFITTIGNIRRVKGTDIFLRAAALVIRKRPDVRFLIVGAVNEPDYMEELQRLVRELGLVEHVIFTGLMSPVPILRRSSVFCMLSRSEGLCNALLEAMACRVPSVATSVGGSVEVIKDGSDGFLVPNEDYHSAAQRILLLLEDTSIRSKMARNARAKIEAMFTVEKMVDTLADFYDRLLGRHDQGNKFALQTPEHPVLMRTLVPK
jgi:glycosyltransferase involved in cell wall biosynthesis